MCQCNPNIRTPYCGKGDCVWPKDKKPQTAVEVMQEQQQPVNENRQQIEQLALHNPYVKKALTAYTLGHYTYEEALQVMVLVLAENNQMLKELAVEFANTVPPRFRENFPSEIGHKQTSEGEDNGTV